MFPSYVPSTCGGVWAAGIIFFDGSQISPCILCCRAVLSCMRAITDICTNSTCAGSYNPMSSADL